MSDKLDFIKKSISFSVVSNSEIPWTIAHQAPLSMEFPRQEYWSGLPFPSPGDLPNPGIKPVSPELQADSLPSEPPGKPHKKDRRALNDDKGINTRRLTDIYALNKGASKYIKKLWSATKGEIDSDIIIVGDFSTSFTSMERSSRQKNKKVNSRLK